MKKLIIDKEKCLNCGTCAAVAPDFFKQGDELAEIIKQPQTEAEWQKVQEAINSCPNSAIVIVEE